MITQLKNRLAQIHTEASNVRAAAVAGNRDLTTEETASIKAKMAEFDRVNDQIKTHEAMDAQAALLATPEPRKVSITGGTIVAATQANHGFKDIGDFLKSVKNAKYGAADPRLAQNAVVTYGNETTNADGAYALPPDFRAGINSMLNGPESLVSRLDQIFTPNLSITMPMDEDAPWSATGIQVAAVSEGAQYAQTKPVLKTFTASLAKYGGLISVSEESLEDGTQLGPYVQKKAADKLNYALNAAVITAIGASGGKITVAKQAAEAVGAAPAAATLYAMYAQLFTAFRPGAVWLANPSLETSFFALNGTAALNYPIYIPAGGILGNPTATLLGKPVLFVEGLAAKGAAGCLYLVDPGQLFAILKSGGVKSDVTPYFAFDQDLVSYKVSVRAAFKSKWSAVITRPDATTASSVLTHATF
jgi:HK97 family phage major capsid protein